jgi:hypothetical protein
MLEKWAVFGHLGKNLRKAKVGEKSKFLPVSKTVGR